MSEMFSQSLTMGDALNLASEIEVFKGMGSYTERLKRYYFVKYPKVYEIISSLSGAIDAVDESVDANLDTSRRHAFQSGAVIALRLLERKDLLDDAILQLDQRVTIETQLKTPEDEETDVTHLHEAGVKLFESTLLHLDSLKGYDALLQKFSADLYDEVRVRTFLLAGFCFIMGFLPDLKTNSLELDMYAGGINRIDNIDWDEGLTTLLGNPLDDDGTFGNEGGDSTNGS